MLCETLIVTIPMKFDIEQYLLRLRSIAILNERYVYTMHREKVTKQTRKYYEYSHRKVSFLDIGLNTKHCECEVSKREENGR